MLISTSDGITSKVIICEQYHNQTSFQLVGSGANIVFKGPDSDFDLAAYKLDPTSYTGGWEPLTYDGADVILNADTNHCTLYGAIVIQVCKTVADGAGVLWKW